MKKLLLVLTIAVAAQAQRPMTFEDLASFRRVGEPALSPDGKWIAYDLSTIDLGANLRRSAIWLMQADGSAARQITDGKKQDSEPAWSPDGKTIAYVSNQDGGSKQVWLYEVATGKTRKLTSLAGGAGTVKWVPNGTAVVLVSDIYPECGVDSKCAQESDAAAEAKPTKGRVIDSLLYRHWTAWQAPTRTHIVLAELAGGTRDLTPGAFDAPPFSVGGGGEFAVSPDSKELVFAKNTEEHPERSTNADLFIVALSGGDATRITTRAGADTSPSYSPDGRWIAYRSQARNGYESDQWELWLYDRDTKQAKRIAADFPNWIESISWSPDSKSLFAAAPLEGRQALYEISLPAGNNARANVVLNSGTADSVRVAPDGKTIYFQMSTLRRPADLYSMKLGGSVTQLTHHNDSLLGQINMGATESVSWTGGDNARVQGWLVKPPNFDATKKYPAVLIIHGGPQGAWSDGWSYRWNPQMFTARGYVVLMPNPRGSVGFGQKFVEDISKDWAGKVWTDLMNGTDMFAALPYVDATHMGAAGASYGGYMIDWILGHTNRFKALVSHDGVYNLESMYGATEEIWFPEWEFGGPPWENREIYQKLSPHNYAQNFETPTLVVHSELDYRVPIDQGLQLFTTLQRKGVPSRLLYFPDEGHWVLKPQNSKLWHQTVLDWLDRWLK